MTVSEAIAELRKLDDYTLSGYASDSFRKGKYLFLHYEWEDDEKFVISASLIPKDIQEDNINDKILDEYICETWIVNKKTGLAEPWYE